MSRIYAITLILSLALSVKAKKHENLSVCSTYKLTGKLSSSLKEEPVLSTYSQHGVPIEIKIKPSRKTSLKLISLKGKSITASVNILSQQGRRHYTGNIVDINIANPTHLAQKSNKHFAKLLNKKYMKCKK